MFALRVLPILLPLMMSATPAFSTPNELALELGPERRAARRVHAGVDVTALGTGRDRIYLFEPALPKPESAPVVIFLHGWRGMNPRNFGAWIDHLVRSGHTVLYPVYQDDADTPPRLVTEAAFNSVARAFATLETAPHVRPDGVAAFGFSMGASIAVNLAARFASTKLTIRALFLLHPGDAHHVARGHNSRSILEPLTPIPASTLALGLVGDADALVGRATATAIFRRLPHLQTRELLLIHSDRSVSPAILASHDAPGAPDDRYDFGNDGLKTPTHIPASPAFPPASASINALDHYVYWKLGDALLDLAFRGTSRDIAFSSLKQRFAGLNPEGRPLPELTPLPTR